MPTLPHSFLRQAFPAIIAGAVLAPSDASAQADNAETFYVDNVESIVQSQCRVCHQTGGVAAGSVLLFTGSASGNHQAMLDYINSPSLGSRADRLLSFVSGQLGHPGGTVLPVGSSDYNTLEQYVTLASAEPPPPEPETVFRAALEEPVQGAVHTGVGNLRGWAVATDGISKIEVYIDDAYVFDAPYGGQRPDIASAFSDVPNSALSGFSLAYNYSDLMPGEHTIRIVAATDTGERQSQEATFTVVKFTQNFIADPNAVNLDAASCMMSGDEISISNGTVDGGLFDFVMKWRTAEQGFEVIEVRGE